MMNIGNETKVVKWHRRAYYFSKKCPVISHLYYVISRIIFGAELPPSVKIGEGVEFAHGGLGVVVHKDAIIGDNTKIMHSVTIGGKDGAPPPIIGDDCFIGVGACILGDIRIGNNVKVGANSVVLNDVPDNCTVCGAPARIVRKDGNRVPPKEQ